MGKGSDSGRADDSGLGIEDGFVSMAKASLEHCSPAHNPSRRGCMTCTTCTVVPAGSAKSAVQTVAWLSAGFMLPQLCILLAVTVVTVYQQLAVNSVESLFETLQFSREVLFSSLLQVGIQACMGFLAGISGILGCVIGRLVPEGSEAEVSKQARRISRLSTFQLMIQPLIASYLVMMIRHGLPLWYPDIFWLHRRPWLMSFGVAFELAAVVASVFIFRASLVLQKEARMHAPAVHGENRSLMLATLVLVGSVLQLTTVPLLSGYSTAVDEAEHIDYSYSTDWRAAVAGIDPGGGTGNTPWHWDQHSAAMNAGSHLCAVLGVVSGAVGVAVATGHLVANRLDYQEPPLWLRQRLPESRVLTRFWLAAVIYVLIVGCPVTLAVDFLLFRAHMIKMSPRSRPENFWEVMQFPVYTLSLLGPMIVLFLLLRWQVARLCYGGCDRLNSAYSGSTSCCTPVKVKGRFNVFVVADGSCMHAPGEGSLHDGCVDVEALEFVNAAQRSADEAQLPWKRSACRGE